MTTPPPAVRRSSLVPIAALLGILAALAWRFHPWVVDDAFISFRYAANLAQGRGLVFNAGERVEGITNLLWTALVACGLYLGAPAEGFARVLGYASSAASVLLAWRLSRRAVGPATSWTLLAPALVVLAPPTAYWAGAGLEGPMFGMLWLASRLAAARTWEGGPRWPLALTLVLLPLCRPDGALPVATLMAAWAVSGGRREVRSWSLVAGVLAVAGGAVVAGKLWWFGAVLPNTFDAKFQGFGDAVTQGSAYLRKLAVMVPWTLLALVPPVVRTPAGGGGPQDGAESSPVAKRLRWLCWLDAWTFPAYVLAVGGDPMPFLRFLAPVLPVMAIAAVSIAASAGGWMPSRPFGRTRVRMGIVVLAGAWSLGFAFVGHDLRDAVFADRIARVGGAIGTFLRRALPPDAVVAANAVGAMPFACGRTVVDMLGLTDRTIASTPVPRDVPMNPGHFRANGAYVLSRRPDVVMLGNPPGSAGSLYYSDRELLRQPGFASEYRPWAGSLSAVEAFAGDAAPVALEPLGSWAEIGGDATPRVDFDTGVLERAEPAGLFVLRSAWGFSVPVHLWRREGVVLPDLPVSPLPPDALPAGPSSR